LYISSNYVNIQFETQYITYTFVKIKCAWLSHYTSTLFETLFCYL